MSTRRALAFSFLDRYAGLLLAIGSSMVIARLLTPADIGVFSVAMVLLSFVNAVRDMGSGQYIVQEANLTPDRLRAAWTVQIGMGAAMALIVLSLAWPAAAFYREPRLTEIFLLLALNFLISPFGSLTYAWLTREMRFDQLAVMRFGGSLVSTVVSVGMALRGHGPISLAAGSLAGTVANAMISALYRPRDFPLRPGFKEVRRVLSVGSQVSLTTLLNVAANSVAELVLARVHGMAAAGLFSRANGLALMFQKLFMDATQSVALPMLARDARETGDIRATYLMATSYVTAVGWSFFLAMIFLANPIMLALYGSQWNQSAEIARVLSIAMMVALISSFCTPALLATEGVGKATKATIISVLEFATLCAIGAWFGLWPLAFLLVLGAIISVAVWLIITNRHIEFGWINLYLTCWKSASVAAISALAPLGVFLMYGAQPEKILFPLTIGLSGAVILFIAGIFTVNHPIKQEFLRLLALFHARQAKA